MQNYISMYGSPDFSFNYNSEVADSPDAQQVFDELRKKYEAGTMRVSDFMQVREYDLLNVQRPSLAQNLDYFFTFQNGYYFVRYLMWNFVGRQNDLEGHMENTRGNWISGISFIDDALWGNQAEMPSKFKNQSTVKFFFLPLLLGLLGCFFQLNKDFGRFWAVLSLFVLTGIGIIFYTSVKPFEPRERDYAMVGSFYAFAIWMGLGAAAILWWLQSKVKSNAVNIIAGVILLGIPLMMGFQNYPSHDRSDRYAAYDYAYSSLKSLPKDGILFVYGDNDTYPVWAIQETEKFRSDVKVVNFTLLATPWNIDQVRRRTYDAAPVPSSLTHEDYRDGTNDQVFVMNPEIWKNIIANYTEQGYPPQVFAPFQKYMAQDSMTIKEAVNFLKTKSPEKEEIIKILFGEDNERIAKFNFIPVNKFIIPVNKQNAVKSGTIKASDVSSVVDYITVKYDQGTMFKNNIMLMDILANFDWKRTINFSNGGVYDKENIFYLQDYLQFDGFSYRLVPIKTDRRVDGDMGRTDANSLYTMMKNFRWGNFKDTSVHFDETATSNIQGYRNAAGRTAEALALSGQKQKAVEILDLASREIPIEKYNEPRTLSAIIYGYMVAGQEQKALKLAEKLKSDIFKEYDYYLSLDKSHQAYLGDQMDEKPAEYALIVAAVSDGYEKIGQREKGYSYLVKSIEPIDKKFNKFHR